MKILISVRVWAAPGTKGAPISVRVWAAPGTMGALIWGVTFRPYSTTHNKLNKSKVAPVRHLLLLLFYYFLLIQSNNESPGTGSTYPTSSLKRQNQTQEPFSSPFYPATQQPDNFCPSPQTLPQGQVKQLAPKAESSGLCHSQTGDKEV